MPTGLTHLLTKRDVSLAEFAWICARQFGALAHMRDSSADASISPEVKPSAYHATEFDKINAEIARLEALTEEEMLAEADAEHRAAIRRWKEAIEADRAQCSRFQSLLATVSAWTPPTADHERLKRLMVEQLEMDTKPYEMPKPVRNGRASWRGLRLSKLRADLNYHAAEHAKEVESARKRTEWIQALWKQLGPPPQNATPESSP